eukprot:6942585-Lingulodinium_polyedra.AAC.1
MPDALEGLLLVGKRDRRTMCYERGARLLVAAEDNERLPRGSHHIRPQVVRDVTELLCASLGAQ